MGLWRSKKTNDGGTSHFIPEQTKRVVEGSNPITFATPLISESDHSDNLNSFAESRKNDFENENRIFNEMIEKEVDQISLDTKLTDEDKAIYLYQIAEQNQGELSDNVFQKIVKLVADFSDKNKKSSNRIVTAIKSGNGTETVGAMPEGDIESIAKRMGYTVTSKNGVKILVESKRKPTPGTAPPVQPISSNQRQSAPVPPVQEKKRNEEPDADFSQMYSMLIIDAASEKGD